MIDKNDVKMPVQKENMKSLLSDNSRRMQVEKLLELVNDAENKQELRLKSDYYSRFHWFGNSATRSSSSYFSYQEEAVYDFIFNLNKSGILSDQVGMGKTIEAGMIISELASRNELRSLLIIVPNEIMAQKWEYELKEKFGVKEHVIEATADDEVDQVYPEVKTLKNYDDFCRCVYECIAYENFGDLNDEKFEHKYSPKNGAEEALEDVIKRFVAEDIKKAVALVSEGASVLLDSSTTCFYLVDYLTAKQNITVFTNNLETALHAIEKGLSVYVLGGKALRGMPVMSGAYTEEVLERIRVDIAFFSSYGVDQNGFVSDPSEEENKLRGLMMQAANRSVLLLDSTKLGRSSIHRLCSVRDVDVFLTNDDRAAAAYLNAQ